MVEKHEDLFSKLKREGFTPEDIKWLTLCKLNHDTEALWDKLTNEYQKATSFRKTCFLPSYGYSLTVDSSLSSEKRWSKFDAVMNPEMSVGDDLEQSIENQKRITVLHNLGFIFVPIPPYPLTESWETVNVNHKGVHISYSRAREMEHLYLVRSSWEKSDGTSRLIERLVYSPSVNNLSIYLQQIPFRLVVPDSHQ